MATILLINPWNFHDEGICYSNTQLQRIWRDPPLGLVQIATELHDIGHDVVVCDLERDLVNNRGDVELTMSQLRIKLREIEPDFVGIGFLSVRYLEAQKIIQLCDEIRSEMRRPFKICAGNIHATSEPELTLADNPPLDVIFLGEADNTFLEWVNGTPMEQISGIAFRKNDTIIIKGRGIISEIDNLPFPDWNFIDVNFYTAPTYTGKSPDRSVPARSLILISSRGCVYNCSFCVYNKPKFRYNSPEYVVKNIEYMLDNFSIDVINFVDSSIGNNYTHLTGVCNEIIKRGLNKRFRWTANMRANQITEDILKLMWKAGCRKLLYGFESGSQRVLDLMKKKLTVEQNTYAVRLHRKLGFPCVASMIIGFPGETVDDLERTLKWLQSVRPHYVGINTYVPLPGSEDYFRLKSEGKIDIKNPYTWRVIGEVNVRNRLIFSDVPEEMLWKYFNEMTRISSRENGGRNFFDKIINNMQKIIKYL